MSAENACGRARASLAALGLFARMSLGKIATVFAIGALLRFALLFWQVAAEPTLRPTAQLSGSGMFVCLAISFLLITMLLCLGGCEYGAKCGYTLRRMRIGERAVFWCQVAYGAAVYLTLWLAEGALAYGFSHYAAWKTGVLEAQTLLLGFYQQEVLHGLLPLEDGGIWVRNAFFVVALALATAEFSYLQRRGRFGATAPALALFVLFMFPVSLGDTFPTVTCIITALIVAAEVLYQLYIKEDPLNE